MSGQIILVAGLPGSGKTTRMHRMLQEGWLLFDDSKAGGLDSFFRRSPRFHELVSALCDGRKSAVADIDFCRTEARQEAESAIGEFAPGVPLDWHFFENDLASCEANIMRRKRDCFQTELQNLGRYSAGYHIPQGAFVLPLWRGDNDCQAEIWELL